MISKLYSRSSLLPVIFKVLQITQKDGKLNADNTPGNNSQGRNKLYHYMLISFLYLDAKLFNKM